MLGAPTNLLTDATSTQVGLPVFTQTLSSLNRTFSFQAILSGSGLVTATVKIEVSNDGTNWFAMHTFSLTGTALDIEAVVLPLPFVQIRANLTAITGTSAQVNVLMSE